MCSPAWSTNDTPSGVWMPGNCLGRVGRRPRRALTGVVVQDMRLAPSSGLDLSVIPDGLRSGLQQMNLAVGIHGPLDVHGVPGVLLNL